MTNAERAQLIAQATEQAYQDLYRLDAELLAELEQLYQGVLDKLKVRLHEYSVDGYFSVNYYPAYVKALERLLAQLSSARRSLLDEALLAAATLGAEPAVLTGLGAVLAKEAISSSVQAAWQHQAADGLQLSDRLWRLDRLAKEALSTPIRQALANGENPLKAARAFLQKSEGIPAEILEQLQALNAGNLQQAIQEQFLTGKGSALYNAQRVFQTEMTRAHGLAYVGSTQQTQGLVGYRFRLSPLHRRVDVCDSLATANSYGLGAGVYPADKIMGIYPAHPNTRSYIVAVYD